MTSFASRVSLATFMVAFLKLVFCTSASMKEPVTLLEVEGPYQPVKGHQLGTIDIYNNMHYEFDVFVNALPSGWACLLLCGATNAVRQPGIWLHPESHVEGSYFEGFHVSFSTVSNWNGNWNGNQRSFGNVQTETMYHFAMDVTQSQLTIRIDDNVVYDDSKEAHYTLGEVPCWSSAPWESENNGIINMSNVLITSVPYTAEPTDSPTAEPTAAPTDSPTAEPTDFSTTSTTPAPTIGQFARGIEKEQHLGYDVVDSGDDAAEDSQDLAAVFAASLAFVVVLVIGVALCYALRMKNGKAETVADEMIVEEDVPDATVDMVVEAPITM